MPERLVAPDTAQASIVEFEHGGATLVVEDFGTADPTFVLLHGVGMGRSVYVDFVRRLRGRVVAIDLPGFGEAPEPTRTLTMERHADLVAAYLRHAGLRDVVVIGHSMGSQIGAELAARHPHLVGALVLAGPTVNSASRTILEQARYLLYDLLRERPEVLLRGAREYLRGGPHLIRKIRATVVHIPERAYARVACPTLVLRGSHDPLAPMIWCTRIVAMIPGSRLEVIPNHGHGTILSDSSPGAQIIQRFVDQLGTPVSAD